MKRLVLFLFLLPVIVFADVDTKDGTAITTSSNIDGFTSNISKIDGQTVTGGGGSSATVLDVPFEGGSEAARLKNLVDNSDPTTVDGATTASSPCNGTYSYDTGGSTNELIYSISNFDPDDFKITVDFKMPSYAAGDHVLDIYIDANNRIRIFTNAPNTVHASVIKGGTTTLMEGVTTVNDSACHTLELTGNGTSITWKIDGNTDDTATNSGTWSGTVSEVNWGIEQDNTSGCDCILDRLIITTN